VTGDVGLSAYRAFQEANHLAVENLNQLCRRFTSIQSAAIRRNEPFRRENVGHRCEKKRRVRSIARDISRRIIRDLDSMDRLVDAYHALTGQDPAGFRCRVLEIRSAFLQDLWYLLRIVVHSLCDDTAFLALQSHTVGLLTVIRPETLRDLLARRTIDPAGLSSLNEIARVLHHLGDEWFFENVRCQGRMRVIPLAGKNQLEVLDINDSDGAWEGDDPATWPVPALAALVRPYLAGEHGAGQETLNVVVVDGLVDTQFTLGLHKARLRSLIIKDDASHGNFISLAYYEPPQTVYSQNIGKRLRYFAGLLERMDFGVETDHLSYLNASFHGHSNLTTTILSEVMRAIISLKDLDEVEGLSDDFTALIDLFQKGVTNLHHYLATVGYFRQFLAQTLDRDAFRTILISQRLNRSDLKVLFEKEIPDILRRRRRVPLDVPDIMRYVESLRQETMG